MKKLIFSILVLFPLFICVGASAQTNPSVTYVDGYVRSNGTYVPGHYKTMSNSTINDNFTTKPNVNPYTGKKGTIEPDYFAPRSYDSYSMPKISSPSYSVPSSSYSMPSSSYTPIQTGPRGGQYYINSNGNKTYVKRSPY
jgi:hypothetical protein